MSSNCLVFHTSGGISSSPAAFLFSIFLRTESSSSCVNGPSLMSNCLPIILVIGSCVIFGGFPSRFSKCCFHSFILSCWFAAFSFALAVFFFLLTSFIVCQAILDCLTLIRVNLSVSTKEGNLTYNDHAILDLFLSDFHKVLSKRQGSPRDFRFFTLSSPLCGPHWHRNWNWNLN